jgi:hypothetical protein
MVPPWRSSPAAFVLDSLQLGVGRCFAAPLFGALDALSPSRTLEASYERDTHAGRSFVRDAAAWRQALFLLKMLGTYGLGRGAETARLRARLDDPGGRSAVSDGAEVIFLGDLLALETLGADTLSPALRARLARADRLVVNLESVVAEDAHEIAPLTTWRGLQQMVRWNRAQDGAVWASRVAGSQLRALLDGLPPVVFSVSNNHAFDDGAAGFARTRSMIEALGAEVVGVVGEGSDGGGVVRVGSRSIGLLPLGFGVNQPEGATGRTLTFEAVPYALPRERVRRELDRLRALGAEHLVALPHWGYEYEHLPRPDVVACAEDLWALGVHAIVGHHPHLVQPCAGSGRRFVAFSLGDFIGGDRNVFSRFACAVSLRLPSPGDARAAAVEVIPIVQSPWYAPGHRVCLLAEAPPRERALWDALHAHKVAAPPSSES